MLSTFGLFHYRVVVAVKENVFVLGVGYKRRAGVFALTVLVGEGKGGGAGLAH